MKQFSGRYFRHWKLNSNFYICYDLLFLGFGNECFYEIAFSSVFSHVKQHKAIDYEKINIKGCR